MAFTKKNWKNRITEYPNRRMLTKQDSTSEIVTVSRSEGTISQEGDAFSAENMNDLEDRIDNAFSTLSNDSVVLATTNPESGSIKFGITAGGQYGYIKAGADSVTPFRNPTGNATQADVRAGKIFSTAALENVAGTGEDFGTVTLTPTGNNTATSGKGFYTKVTADGRTSYAAGVAAGTNAQKNVRLTNRAGGAIQRKQAPAPTYWTGDSATYTYTATEDCVAIVTVCGHAEHTRSVTSTGTALGSVTTYPEIYLYRLAVGKKVTVTITCGADAYDRAWARIATIG